MASEYRTGIQTFWAKMSKFQTILDKNKLFKNKMVYASQKSSVFELPRKTIQKPNILFVFEMVGTINHSHLANRNPNGFGILALSVHLKITKVN